MGLNSTSSQELPIEFDKATQEGLILCLKLFATTLIFGSGKQVGFLCWWYKATNLK